MASDVISRQALLKRLNNNFVALKKSKKATIIDSTLKIVSSEPSVELDDKKCLDCMVSSPVRKWHKVTDAKPKALETILTRLKDGSYVLARYNNGGWLCEIDGMWISRPLDVEEWKAI